MLHLEFNSESENEGIARIVTSAYIMRFDPDMEEMEDVKTAVSEAVTNCIVHAYFDENGKIKNCVWEAKKRGVYMDDCHGRVHWSYPNLQNAFSQGFYPDIISSDLVRVSEYTRPGFSLLYAMSVNSAAGMPVEKILQSVTYTPAKALGIESKAGEIREGAPADVAILDIRDVKDKTFTDNYGNSVSGNKLFVPLMTVRAGRTAYRQIFF